MDTTAQDGNNTSTAGVIARPPLLFLGALLLGLGLDRVLPLAVPIADPIRWSVAAVAILGGLAVFLAGIRSFARAGTPIPTTQPTRALVTTGIHGRTRNPIYLGLFLVYGGIGVAALSTWMFIVAVPLALTMRYGVVAREEAYLGRLFGDAYRDYKARVRRWV